MKALNEYIIEAMSDNAFAVKKGDKLFLDKKEYKDWWMVISMDEKLFTKKSKEWMNSTNYVPNAPLGNVENAMVFYTDDVKKMNNLDFDELFSTEEKGHVKSMLLYEGDKLNDKIFQNGKWVK